MPVDPTSVNNNITSNITSNGKEAITGAILASVLLGITAASLWLAGPAFADNGVPGGGGNGVPVSNFGSTTPFTAMGNGATSAIGQAIRAGYVYNIADYGAKCDNSTDDSASISAAIQAAIAKAVSGHTVVKVVGPINGSACKIVNVNATGGLIAGNGAGIILDDMNLVCSNAGAPSSGNNFGTCFDATGSRWMTFGADFSLSGSGSIGLQIGTAYLPIGAGSHDCCQITVMRAQIQGNFSFAAIYNDQAEETHMYDPYVQNNGSTTGPISAQNGLGAITTGSGGTNGTYTAALTGGTGAGAIANITVSGGGVTAVSFNGSTLDYQGKGYSVGDSLSAASASIGGVTGFSVPVQNISPYAYVADGADHWRHQSVFISINAGITPDTYYTFTQQALFGGQLLYNSSQLGVPLWVSYSRTLSTYSTYLYSGGGASDINLFDNSATNSAPSSMAGMHLDFTPEYSGTSIGGSVNFDGSNATQEYDGLKISDPADGSLSIFSTAANILSLTGTAVDFSFPYVTGSTLFDAPSKYNLNGKISIPRSSLWSTSAAFNGIICDTQCSYVANTQQMDVFNYYPTGGIINMDCPSNGGSGGCTVRLFRTAFGTAPVFQILEGNNSNTAQDLLSGQSNSYLQALGGSLSIGSSSYCPTNEELCVSGAVAGSSIRSGVASNSDLTGRITLNGGTYTYALLGAYTTVPNCITNDVTTPANNSYAVEGTTSIVFHGTGADVIKYICVGLN